MGQILLENSNAGFILVIGGKIAVFESKTAFLGSDNSGFEAKIIISSVIVYVQCNSFWFQCPKSIRKQ